MSEKIRAKVAKILNTRELVITAGTEHGVVVGMLFDVMDQKGENIRDPDTGEILGSIERPKVRVRITDTKKLISVASTFRKKKVNIGGQLALFDDLGTVSRSLMPRKYVTKYETLKTDEKTWEDLDEAESYVKTGDQVVQVIDDRDSDEPEGTE